MELNFEENPVRIVPQFHPNSDVSYKLVVDELDELELPKSTTILACGMTKQFAEYAKKAINHHWSLETNLEMADEFIDELKNEKQRLEKIIDNGDWFKSKIAVAEVKQMLQVMKAALENSDSRIKIEGNVSTCTIAFDELKRNMIFVLKMIKTCIEKLDGILNVEEKKKTEENQ